MMVAPHTQPTPITPMSTRKNDAEEHPAPQGVTIYYWPCSLVLLARSLLLDRPTGPLSATLRIACAKPYFIEVNGQQLQTRASLVAPKAERKRIFAVDSEVALFYLPLDMPEYAGVRAVLGDASLVELPIEIFEPFIPRLQRAMRKVVSPQEIKDIVAQVVAAMTRYAPATRTAPAQQDERVLKACRVLDEMPLRDFSLDAVAREVHLSSSRLRDLFKQQTGFTIGDYARWRAVWRAALLWQRGLTITRVAEEAGFHDLAHADRAFNQVFGMNPSSVIDPKFVTLVSCE